MRTPHDRSLLSQLGNGLLVCTLMQWSGRALGGTALPVPCVATSCGTGAKGFVTSGSATATQTGTTLSVNQTTSTATLNWSSFNIGAGGKVVFVQPSSTSIALNRIFDSNPSSIFGALSANGQIYLINANGFLFGNGATVNVAGLLVSSLNLTDANFAKGILTPGESGKAVLTSTDSGGTAYTPGVITVESGATLTAADGGRLLLAAPNVTNGGTLSAPDGQVILAAGQSVYLQASTDSSLRGLIVEVDNGGTVANQLSGSVSAARGNVTLTGLMVNQDGRVSATTSVSANGSIILQAADTAHYDGTSFSATRGGTVELGSGSLTEVIPDYSDTTTAVDSQAQLKSSIAITGEKVFMHDATIDAPSGNLTVLAEADPSAGVQTTENPNAEIRIDSGTSIDLSGSDAELPMSANLVTVELRSNELADDPTQKGGALQSTSTNTVTVTVDMRADGGKGTSIADLSSAIAAVGKNIAQRTETGGTATFKSEGDVVLSSGASINVSGGYTTYLGGVIQTTKLVGANGQLYDIGSASSDLTYTGVVNPTFTESYDKWGIKDVIATPGLSQYESTYVQGADAGTVQFAAHSMVLDGTLKATAVTGRYQRSSPPSGGTLIIGFPQTPGTITDYLSPTVTITDSETPTVVADGTPLTTEALQLPVSDLTSDGFTNTTVYSNTSITLPAATPLVLTPGASLSLIAPQITVDSSITSVAGTLTFENVQSDVTPAPTSASAAWSRQGIDIGDGVTLDVSGRWTNDSILADGIGTDPLLESGGTINLQLTTLQSQLVLGNDVSLKANGGAWLKSGGTVSYGGGGAITIDASPALSALQFGADTVVQAFGTGTASGGTFTLYAPRIEIAQGSGTAWTEAQRVDDLTSPGGVLQLYAPLFSDEGFSSINLTATGAVQSYATTDVLTVASGTTIDAQTQTLRLNSNYQSMPTGSALATFTQATLLPLYERPVTDVSLNVLRLTDDEFLGSTQYGTLDVQAGASILADPGATLSLKGEGGVVVAGTLQALGGTIDISIPAPAAVDENDTSGLTDPGYLSTLGIDIASTAVLDVHGTTVMTPNAQGQLLGSVKAGGTVAITAERGTVVTEAGSTIDIQGTNATLDVTDATAAGGYTREVVASAGGSLTVQSPEAISLLGNLHAAAATGTGGTAAAGSLEVDLVRDAGSVVVGSGTALPSGTLEIELVDSTAGGSASSASSGLAVLGAQQLVASGIDSLTLRAGGTSTTTATSTSSLPHAGDIDIDTAQLSLARQLILDAPSFTVQASASLSAPFVEIGNSVADSTGTVVPTTPTAGSGTLTVSAQQMDVIGNFALQGAASVTLNSSGDVQLEGVSLDNVAARTTGSIVTSGNLTIDALRVYPDTYTEFSITSTKGNGATVSIGSTGASPGTPLSADGSLSITADNISISGSVYAPFGSISLDANNALTLASGSLVSVSGAGVDVAFGQTQSDQTTWTYVTPGGTSTITSVPSKQISLSAPNITVQSGSTTDVSGGGSLYAYEWVPGTGGSIDNLSATASSYANLYAIIPATKNNTGPYDPQESTGSAVGETIYISGGAGIAAGYYTLLPARYALSSGAVLIQLEPTYVSASGGQIGSLANGTPVIAGYLSTGTTGIHLGGTTEYEGVAVYPSGYYAKLANYVISDASTYFTAAATAAGSSAAAVTADAGTLNIAVTAATVNSLTLDGSVLTAAASGGRGATINVSAPDLEITSGTSSGSAGALAVSASVLQSWDASSLTLGGTSSAVTETTSGSTTTDSSSIAVAANNVTVDSGVQLSADQIVLVAQQSIDVEAGASLMSTSGKNGTVLSTLPSVDTVSLTDTNSVALPQGALLAVSDLYVPVVARSSLNGATAATISVQQGATLSSGGALAVDAPGYITLAGTLNGKGASWSLSSGSVAFVGSGSSNDTLNIDSALLSTLQTAGALRIASQGSIDIDSAVSLGVDSGGTTPTLSSLTLVASSINNQAAGNSVFGGTSVLLEGVGTVDAANPPAAAATGSGSLSIVADTVTVGSGVLSVNGFAQTTAQVAGAIETQGSGYLNVGGNLTLNASELTPGPDASDAAGTTLAATGTLTLGAPTASASSTLPTLIGGSLTLSAADIEDAGKIVAPAGVVELTSTGNLHLASTASIDAGGTSVEAVTTTTYANGGRVMLTAGGDLALDAGSSVSVAGTSSTPAGTLDIVAASGTVTLAGTLNGASSGSTGGTLVVNAGTLSGGLMSLVSGSGLSGFSDSVDIRTHTGDLDLSSGSSLTANNITLTADSGSIDIAGTLNAPSADQRGVIDLSGATGVTLAATGQLHADGSGTTGRGGEIELNSVTASCSSTPGSCTTTGSITLDSGSVISTYGAAQMGELVLRAPAVSGATTDDVAINQGSSGLGADVSQVGQVIVDAVLVSSTTGATVNADLSGDVLGASSFLSAATPAIAARLTSASTTPVTVQAGVELQDANAGDALMLQSLDLASYSTQGQVINVAVRAAGDVTIDGTISDGFTKTTAGTVLTNMASGSLSFVAGADLSSANTVSTLSASAAALELEYQAIVRTGTGDINLAAAGDVIFDYGTSGGGATVYTAGLAGTNAVTTGKGKNATVENFATGGGNVVVTAGADVVGAALTNVNPDGGNYSVTGWQPRGTTVSTTDASVSVGNYGVNFDKFDWNLGALGGGDLSVTAGGQVSNLSAATADSSNDGGTTIYGAGGGLRINAVGNVGSAQVYIADGVGTITTGGGLVALLTDANGSAVGSSFALGDAQISVWARQSVQVDAVYNPTFISTGTLGKNYFTYGSESALDLSSTDGDVTLNSSTGISSALGVLLGTSSSVDNSAGLAVLPANVSVQALQEDVVLNTGSVILYPSSTGQLSLFAGRDIVGGGSDISMADSAAVPTAADTTVALATSGFEIAGLVEFQGDIHTDDSQPALVTAGRDIDDDCTWTIPKDAQISAGRDIVNLGYKVRTSPRPIPRSSPRAGISRIPPRPAASSWEAPAVSMSSRVATSIWGRNGIFTTGNLANANLSTLRGRRLDAGSGVRHARARTSPPS
jgi:filamentous hemagglutinin